MARIDEIIKKDIIEEFTRDDRLDASKISVEVSNGTVTLRGEVPTYFSRTVASEDAQKILGVTNVRNQLLVNFPATVPIPTDSEIENSIRARLAVDPDIDILDIEVMVSAGRVTLRGSVDAYWKKMHAEDLIASEPGVVIIDNELAIVPTDDIADKAIAENIVDSLEARAEVDADDVNVRVRDGYVSLNGTVPSWSARRAADEAALYTAGVTNVSNHLAVSGV